MNAVTSNTLTDLLGQTCSVIKAGQVEFIVRPLKLGQFDQAKQIIAEVMANAVTEKSITDPRTNEKITFTDQDLMAGFLKSDDLIKRFLVLSVEIKQAEPDDYLKMVAFDDIPLNLAAKLLREVFTVNDDFFQECLALVVHAIEKIGAITDKVAEMAGQAIPQGNLATLAKDDLTQPGVPIGERSPLRFSLPESASNN